MFQGSYDRIRLRKLEGFENGAALTALFEERSTNWKSCFVLTHSSSGFSNTNCHRQTAIKLYEVKVFPLAANTGINSTPVHNEEKPRYNCWFLIQCRS